jgi:hypothetical protein
MVCWCMIDISSVVVAGPAQVVVQPSTVIVQGIGDGATALEKLLDVARRVRPRGQNPAARRLQALDRVLSAQAQDAQAGALGSTLWQAVEPLSSWARDHVSEILTSRKQFDKRDAR